MKKLDFETMNWEDNKSNQKQLSREELFNSGTASNQQEKDEITENVQSKEESSQSVTEQQDNNSKPVDDKMVTVTDFIQQYRDKLECELLDLTFIKSSSYLIFREKDSNGTYHIYCHYPLEQLYLYNLEPEKIKVNQSGIIIESPTCRSYVAKTFVKQFYLDDNKIPYKCITIRKNKKKIEENEQKHTSPDADVLKLYISRSASKLHKKCNDIEDWNELIKTILQEMQTITDINYLINIEEQVLLDSREGDG